jgi:hypothetical protein
MVVVSHLSVAGRPTVLHVLLSLQVCCRCACLQLMQFARMVMLQMFWTQHYLRTG